MKKGLYVKPNRGTPKFFVPLKEEEKFISIYAKTNKGIPVVRSAMVEIAMNKGKSKVEAMIEARDAWNLFNDACLKLGEEKKYPFLIDIKPLDMSKVLTFND